jgi:hypothetical protein
MNEFHLLIFCIRDLKTYSIFTLLSHFKLLCPVSVIHIHVEIVNN